MRLDYLLLVASVCTALLLNGCAGTSAEAGLTTNEGPRVKELAELSR